MKTRTSIAKRSIKAWLILALLGGLLAFQASRSGRLMRSLRQSAGALQLRTEQALAKRAVYPFSLVPGGTLTAAELRSRPDRYARKFYGDLDYKTAQSWRSYGETHYNSYRIGNRIYQKTTLSRTRIGELLIKVQRHSGEVVFIRARCGNLLLDSITAPVQNRSDQPDDVVLGSAAEKPQPPPFSPPTLLAYTPHFSLPAFGSDPLSAPQLTPPAAEILPASVPAAETPLFGNDFSGGGLGGGSGVAAGPAQAKNGPKNAGQSSPAFTATPLTPLPQTPPSPAAPVPEPASLWPLLLLSLFCAGLVGKRQFAGHKRRK